MAGDLIRPLRRAVLARLKADPEVLGLVPAASIHPSTTPASLTWPFIRWDGPSSVPITLSGIDGATVRFLLHAFARPREAGGLVIETAEDHVSRIGSAMVEAVNNHRVPLEAPLAPATARLHVRSSIVTQDAAEADAYHAVLTCEARILVAA